MKMTNPAVYISLSTFLVFNLTVMDAIAQQQSPDYTQPDMKNTATHDHRQSKGLPGSSVPTDKTVVQEKADSTKSQKNHDHRKSKGLPSSGTVSGGASSQSNTSQDVKRGHEHTKSH